MRNRRLTSGRQDAAPDPARGPAPARVPRLRLGRHRGARPQAACRCARSRAGSATWRPSLPAPVQGTLGIGHTRWATHGPPTDVNAHPHRDATGGSRSCTTASSRTPRAARQARRRRRRPSPRETDTEVLAHLIARSAGRRPLEEAVREALARSSAPTGSRCWTPSTRTGSWSPATAARSSSASATRRCSSPPTSPRWSGTPARSCTSTTASWPRSRADGFRTFARTHENTEKQPLDRRPGRPGRPTPAATSTSCARRSSSSRTRSSGRCAAGWTSGSAPRTSAG